MPLVGGLLVPFQGFGLVLSDAVAEHVAFAEVVLAEHVIEFGTLAEVPERLVVPEVLEGPFAQYEC